MEKTPPVLTKRKAYGEEWDEQYIEWRKKWRAFLSRHAKTGIGPSALAGEGLFGPKGPLKPPHA
jgi:hypothetical protein